MNRRDNLYHIQKTTGKDSHRQLFKKVKYEVDCMTKTSYNAYLHSLVGITDKTPDTDSSRPNTKKLFSFLKNCRQDSQGSSPLKKDEQLCTDNVQKANLLNCQFQLVFTPKSPLTLKQLCQQKVQDLQESGHYNPDNVPPEARNKYTCMTDITISVNGITKLLQGLKPDKAPGPDRIRPLFLQKLQEWELDWNMEFNPGKCQVIRITRSRSPIPTQYSLHGQTLEVVASARYLGVDIANDLSWKPHISRITNNANKSLGFLRRNLKAKNPELRELTYKAIVRPQLEYAAPVWDPYIQEDIQRIEMVQRRAARWVLSDYSPYSSVSDMLGRLGWRTLEQRRADSRLVLFYKIVHGLVAIPLPTYVIPLNRYSWTTHPLAFRQLYARTDYYKYSFFPLAVVQWNNLSARTATLTNLDSFKLAICQECHFRP